LLSTSVSLASRLPLTGLGGVSSFTAATSATATGASLVPVTVTVSVDELKPP
jgi:dihydroorotate dehydrogenase